MRFESLQRGGRFQFKAKRGARVLSSSCGACGSSQKAIRFWGLKIMGKMKSKSRGRISKRQERFRNVEGVIPPLQWLGGGGRCNGVHHVGEGRQKLHVTTSMCFFVYFLKKYT